MLRKSVLLVTKNINKSSNLRWLSLIQASPTESYMKHIGSEPLQQATISQAFLETVNKHPTRLALRSVHEGAALTYEQLLKQADALACALRAQGLQRGDRLGVWAHNCAACVVAILAAARAGLIAALINPAYEKSELSYCLKKVGVKSLVVSEQLPNRRYHTTLNQLIPQLQNSKPGRLSSDEFPDLISVIAAGKEKFDGAFNFESLVEEYANQDASKYASEVKPEDGSIIHFTSGTTGNPKAGLDSQRGVVNNTYFVGKRLGYHDGHQDICVQAPIFHALGSVVTLLGGWRHGATLTLPAPLYDARAALQALHDHQCSIITGTPTMFVDMLSQMRGSSLKPRLRRALAAGAPLSPQLVRDIHNLLHVDSVKTLYGLTEATAGLFQSLPEDGVDVVADTVGFLHDHLEVKVVDQEGKTVPWGSSGELLQRGYSTMLGYWAEPGKTSEVLADDGWLSTGDKFVLRPDGYARIVGRLKDIVVRGGENIAPKEIEDLLNTHPDIVESQVVGVSDERVGEELCAVVRLRPGASITLDDARRHLAGKLARFKMPRILKTVDDFPKTTSGKIQKFKLKDMVEAGKI
ncbi:acyl-CoA synthetase family member 2, mitochondrial isoform X3 [Ostrinia furnacalis]|uniref:acyl-CoA synthetase family member 2, mitochondrial isoform X1 n=1 Tax=Ostrinia furnacalis TaxID=93504 RepID=UPI00103B00A5|nr:acyl-CoA synthetase family member 2, mitochondrial isoform X1 [Ostrinia furnacalis]XP_028172249.1 acyl-CoA synthetase family member 2, mitochondrial isoform X2 [Ostrinia furnacalis]XP_028172258.1 acyl-CoA synthetase family member 2, mitochondrial isoform X3 [Ostrinia furnacalis]